MKKLIILSNILIGLLIITSSAGNTQNNAIFDKIRITAEEIPDGFMFALIADMAKTTLKSNPWEFDEAAIKKLTDKIYPGGDYRQISGIHMTMIAKKETPHRDDIVCYLIKYKNSISARDEIKKFSEYIKNNQDRAILHIKDNLAVFLFVDNIDNFQILKDLDKKISERIDKI